MLVQRNTKAIPTTYLNHVLRLQASPAQWYSNHALHCVASPLFCFSFESTSNARTQISTAKQLCENGLSEVLSSLYVGIYNAAFSEQDDLKLQSASLLNQLETA